MLDITGPSDLEITIFWGLSTCLMLSPTAFTLLAINSPLFPIMLLFEPAKMLEEPNTLVLSPATRLPFPATVTPFPMTVFPLALLDIFKLEEPKEFPIRRLDVVG